MLGGETAVVWDAHLGGIPIELIGIERADHIQNVIDGLRAVGAELGLREEDRAG